MTAHDRYLDGDRVWCADCEADLGREHDGRGLVHGDDLVCERCCERRADDGAGHRLTLRRGDPWGQCVLWVMLNPSTADDRVDDPTIRRVRAFSAREAYQSFRVVNLWSLRATKPADLWAAPPAARLHPDADAVIRTEARRADMVVVGWGAHGDRCPHRVREVLDILHGAGHPILWRLGEPTRSGQPRHPLYLAADTPWMAHSERRANDEAADAS